MRFSKRQTHLFLFLSIFVFAISCSKQKSPEIVSEEIRGSREIERLEACSRVNFNKGVLLYKNALDMFVCTKWDEQFPHMYNSMKKITGSSWDHLMGPIDQEFVSNQQRRDRTFKNIRELDSKNGLDDLSYVIVALNETNFFDSTKAMFTCVDNPGDPVCNSRAGRIPEKKSLKNILKIVEASPESIDNLSQFIRHLIKAMDGHSEELRTEINKFRASPLFVPTRLQFVDAFANKMANGLTDEDRKFAGKILLTGDVTGDVPWIYAWLQDARMSREKFRDLIEYPVLMNPEFVSEFRGIKKAYNDNFSCSIKGSANANDILTFDFKEQLANYANVIRTSGQKRFFEFANENLIGMKMSTEICRELEQNKYKTNFNQALVNFTKFVGEQKFYDLVKFLVNHTTAKGDPNGTFSENIYLADLVTGSIFSSMNALNSDIVLQTREFYPILYDVVKSLPPESYIRLGELLNAVTAEENDRKLKGVADFWSFFTPEEKNFVFNFVDRHFDKETNYVLLFDFYTKFLDDYAEVQQVFKDKWTGSAEKEEMSYLTLQDFFTNLAGKDTLLDFKKFFSRDQILRVLEVISNGENLAENAKQELAYIYSDNYVIKNRSEKYVFKITYDQGFDPGYDSKAVLDCMQKLSDIQNGFYELVRNLPAACTKVTNANIAMRLYGWLNTIENDYLAFKKAPTKQDSLFDQNGLLSPYMLNSTIGLSKTLDTLIGPLGSRVPTRSGLNYLLSSFDYHLNEKGAATVVNTNLQWLNSLLDVVPDKNIQHRNALVKIYSKEDNFSYSKNFFDNVGKLFTDYGDWIKSGEYAKAQSRSLGEYDPKLSCEKTINQVIAPYPCPSKEVVKVYGNDLLFLLKNIFEVNEGSPIASIMKAAKPGEGLDIPLDGKKTYRYRISLRDVLSYLYETSDRSYAVNNMNVTYVNEQNQKSVQNVTTLERVESVIREVRFGNNYLGVSFLNAVVHGDNYNSDVLNRKKLLAMCVKIAGVRCGRKMTDSDLRMALNSLEVYDGLADVNNARGLEPKFQFGDFLKTFESSLVGSSAIEAQKEQLLPLPDRALLKHNGRILSDMTVMTMWSNSARVLRDRIGRQRKDFEAFINREDFKRVDRALFYGFDLPVATASAERLINKFISIPSNEKQNLFGHTVDWMTTLNYDQTRLVEDTFARLMVVGSYLGTPEVVFNKSSNALLSRKYASNNLFQVFLALEKLIDYWPSLKTYFPGDVKLIDVFKPVNTALYFLTEKLNSSTVPEKNPAYLALNDIFLVLQTSVFEDVATPKIGANPDNTTKGLDLILEMLKSPKLVSDTYSLIRTDYKYLDVFHQNSGEWFSTIGQNLKRVTQSSQVDLTPVRDYLAFTSKNLVCKLGDGSCLVNYHYDEPASLIRYLNKKDENEKTNFQLLNQKLFIENTEQISQMLTDLLPAIKIKEVKPPFRL